MSTDTSPTPNNNESRVSPDIWAVIVAFLLTLAVKLGLFHKVPW